MRGFIYQLASGISSGYRWYGRRLKESKWYIIPMIIDTVLIPLKIVVIPLICLTKKGRAYFIRTGEKIDKE